MSDKLKTKEGLYSELTYKVIGSAMTVYSTLGPGHPEEIYQKALEHELKLNQLDFEPQKAISIQYKGTQVGLRYLDFLVEDRIILEIKSVNELNEIHQWQVLSYLAATSYEVALLINFGKPKLEYKRILPSKKILEHRRRKFTANEAD